MKLSLVFGILAMAMAPLVSNGGNQLDDFDTILKDVTTNYQSAIDAGPDSRMAADYTKKLSDLVAMGNQLQEVVTRLQIEDINLRQNTIKLKDTFTERLDNNGKSRGRSMSIESRSDHWFPTNQLRNDIKKLRSMGFTTENGGSYKRKLEKPDGFEEYENLINNYAATVKERYDYAMKGGYNESNDWRQAFERKMDRMEVLATAIQVKLIKELPEQAKSCNFQSETVFLEKCYKDMLSYAERVHSAKKAGGNANNVGKVKVYDDTTKKTKNMTDGDRIMKDVTYSVKKVQDAISKLKGVGFSLDGKMTREAKEKLENESKASSSSASNPSKDKPSASGSDDLSSMSVDQLEGALQAERTRIYKANLSMDSISPIIVKYYMHTLTSSQKELFRTINTKYQNRDYSGDLSSGMALKELNGKLQTMESTAKKEELVKIIQNVRKEKEQFEKDLEKERYAPLNR